MIDDLDKTIEELLKRELSPDLISQMSISFATPDDQFPPSAVHLPAIDFFLYDVRENRELRSNEWILERRSEGTVTKQRSPVRIDCSYLITAWPSQSSNNPAEDEHRLLSEVMIALLRHPIIPPAVLKGRLAGQDPAMPATALQAGHLQSPGEFWQALGGKPGASLHYTVTIGVIAAPPVEAGRAVVDKRLRFKNGAMEE